MPTLKGKAGIRAFLKKNVGKVVTTEQIRHASGNQGQYARRLRELRDEDGWPIQSHKDASDLKSTEYRLQYVPDKNRPVEFSRRISYALRHQALERNGFTCQKCGAGAGDTDENGKNVHLQVHHITAKSEGGEDKLSNLETLCTRCNQGAKNVAEAPPSHLRLMAVLRKANREDQRKAYQWLKEKFDNQTSEH